MDGCKRCVQMSRKGKKEKKRRREGKMAFVSMVLSNAAVTFSIEQFKLYSELKQHKSAIFFKQNFNDGSIMRLQGLAIDPNPDLAIFKRIHGRS